MLPRSLLLIALLCPWTAASDAYSQRGGYPPGFLPGSPLYSPTRPEAFRRYIGGGKWRSVGKWSAEHNPSRYDNNQGRFDLRPHDGNKVSPPFVFRHPNHKPTRDDMNYTIEMMRAGRWR